MVVNNNVFISLVFLIGAISGLVELPHVDDNNIITTEAAIRDTINTLFNIIQVKGMKKNAKLQEYSIVHNHLISFTLQDYTTLIEIAKLTRVDKSNINNETENFIAALNELLDKDVEIENKDTATPNNKDVTSYIDLFLRRLRDLKAAYGVNNENLRINQNVYRILAESNDFMGLNNTGDTRFSKSNEDDAILGDNTFWTPDQSGRRIYRGEKIKIKYFPFMANVQLFNQFHCGGAIIKSDLIVTAASCLQLAYNNRFFRENPAFLSVRVGSDYYNGGEKIPVLEVYFYPEYNPKNLKNNICLLRLVRKLNLKRRRVKRIKIDRAASTMPFTIDGVTIIGWGAKGSSNVISDPWKNSLSYAILDVYPLRECQDVYSKEYVTKKNFCAGFFSKGGGACNRDVGGPGVVEGTLMGVVSFGSPVCGTPDAPTVFTKIGYYSDWIEEIMEQNVPYVRMKTTTRQAKPLTLSATHYILKPTTFKIPPLSGKMSPIPVHEADSLRMLHNVNLFDEFLSTMFGSKENNEYQDLLRDKSPKTIAKKKEGELLTKGHGQTHVTEMDIPTESYREVVTAMGDIEPTYEENEATHVTEMTAIEMISELGPDKDKELEKDLVDLIDNIDLKQIIDDIPSLEEEKLLDNFKIIDLLKDKQGDRNISKGDDSVLTLLYLSDSEKNKEKDDNLNVFDDEDGNSERGMSIATDSFKDMTYRNKNTTILNDLISKEDLYNLLLEAINGTNRRQ